MPVSPTDFSLWARLTGNRYPSNAEEKARIAPDVHRFIQNMDKQGAVEVSNPKEKENKDSLGKKIAKGALIAGGTAATLAAAIPAAIPPATSAPLAIFVPKLSLFSFSLGFDTPTAPCLSIFWINLCTSGAILAFSSAFEGYLLPVNLAHSEKSVGDTGIY